MMTAATIVDEALALPLPERSWVAERLLLSLDEDRPLSDEWRAEIARRVARRAAGESRIFSREEVRQDVQALLS
jgi:putative addiction module component (TIGR02574 family)